MKYKFSAAPQTAETWRENITFIPKTTKYFSHSLSPNNEKLNKINQKHFNRKHVVLSMSD